MSINHTKSETWSVSDLTAALGDTPQKKQRIIIPKFQRTLVWSKEQKKDLINSIKRGFPIGAILLFKVGDDADGTTRYNLIDGLQRSSTLKQYALEPTQFYDETNLQAIDATFFQTVSGFAEAKDPEITLESVVGESVKWLREKKAFEEAAGYSSFDLVTHMNTAFELELSLEQVNELTKQAVPFLDTIRKESSINEFQIPVLVFNGQQDDLPTIFERLNSQGTQLSKYQIYAAAWAVYRQIPINNREIIDHIRKKYDSLIEDGYEVENYDATLNLYTSEFSVFEYLFGLGKFLSDRYEHLFSSSAAPEQEDSIGFNVANICLGLQFSKMNELPVELLKHDLTKFEEALIETIDFVFNSLKGYISLKMNKRTKTLVAHTEMQIVSMIGKVFRIKFDEQLSPKDGAEEVLERIEKNLPYHYLSDIIREYWRGSGDTKAFETSTSNKYERAITRKAWSNTIDDWYLAEVERKEKTRVRVKDSSILFLKYLYTHSLTANEELSNRKFEIEHLVPVEKLKPAAAEQGLPIGAFPNLCLLDLDLNRSKGGRTFYEYYDDEVKAGNLTADQANAELTRVEQYSHTQREDLQFVSDGLTGDAYFRFLDKRVEKLKELFFDYNGIKDSAEN